MAALEDGTLSRSGYGAMLAQHLHVYWALDAGFDLLADDPVAAPFLSPALSRVAAWSPTSPSSAAIRN